MSQSVYAFLITSAPEFDEAARAELAGYDPTVTGLQPGEKLAPGLFLVESQLADFAAKVAANPPIYVRHLFPVQAIVPLENSLADLEKLAESAARLPGATDLTAQTPLAVQVRLIGPEEDQPANYVYSPYGIKERIGAALSGQEAIKAPEQIVSVLCIGERAFIGLSPATENLSSWAGGMRRLAKRPEQVSRAELKLEEALEVFGVILPSQGEALDLGAAPGGWTRLLLEAGLRVSAIDPAALDPRLLVYGKRLTHFRSYAERFLEISLKDSTKKGYYRAIVADLRMDAKQAANLLVKYAPLLASDGLALTTLKLPHEAPRLNPTRHAAEALDILRGAYPSVRARQLFHNRQEITVLLSH